MHHFWLRQGVRYVGVWGGILLFLLPLQRPAAAGQGDQAYWISQAEERIRLGDREGALKAFQQAAWQRPQDPAIHYNMGVLAESLGRPGEAVGHYTSYLRWAPEAEDRESVRRKVFRLCGNLGAQAYQSRQFLRALDWYEKARDLYPYAKAVYFNMSRVYEARGDWRKAAGCLKEYHTLCDLHEREAVEKKACDYLRKDGEGRFREGDYDGALASFQEAARWNPEDSRLLLNQALCEEKIGLWEDAKDHYLAYLQIDPMSQEREAILERVLRIHVRLGEEYLARGYIARAQGILEKGLEIDPENQDLLHLFAKTCFEAGKPEQSVAYLERILEVGSGADKKRPIVDELVQLATSLADDAYRAQHYQDALRFLKKALLRDPDNPVLSYNLARVYEGENEWEQAILAYRRYLFLNPDAAERNEVKAKLAYYYSFLGTELFVRGDYPQAQEAFEQALLVKPEDRALLYNLSMVLLKRGKSTEALHFLQRYLEQETDPKEIERVQRQITVLVRLKEEDRRRKRAKSDSSGLATLAEKGKGTADLALEDREKAFVLLQTGRWKEALDVYEDCVRRFPSLRTEEAFQREFASAYREISRTALVGGNLTEALEALEEARQWAPTESFPYLWEGSVHEHMGNSEKALEVYRESLRNVEGAEGRQAIRARIVAILTERLASALRGEKLADALETMNTLEPYLDEQQARDVHYQRARIEGALGRKQQALLDYGLHLFEASRVLEDPRMRAELISLVRDQPDLVASIEDPSEAYSRAKEAASRGDHSKALFCFLIAKSDGQAPADLDSEIFLSLQALKMDREALSILSHSSRQEQGPILPKTQADELVRRAEPILLEDYRTGRYERGLERIRSIQAQLPEPDGKLALLQGVFEEMTGRYEDAIDRYEEALQSVARAAGKQVSPVSQRLCVLLIRKSLDEYEEGNYEASLESLRRAEQAVPGRSDVAFDLGCVYLRLKNPRAALQAFGRYMELEQSPSPRKEMTADAIGLLERQLARSPVVRYDGEGIAVDLIFERPVSLGNLIASAREEKPARGREDLLDSVVLAPYLELPSEGQNRTLAPAFALD